MQHVMGYLHGSQTTEPKKQPKIIYRLYASIFHNTTGSKENFVCFQTSLKKNSPSFDLKSFCFD